MAGLAKCFCCTYRSILVDGCAITFDLQTYLTVQFNSVPGRTVVARCRYLNIPLWLKGLQNSAR